MVLFYIMIIGIAITGGGIVKFTILGINYTYITFAALLLSYLNYFRIHRGKIALNKLNKTLIRFEVYALIVVILSFLGINKVFGLNDLFYSKSYIIRQAYYLFVIPVIILMGDNRYTDIWKKDIEKNAEFLIWIIYIGHIIYFKKFSLQVPAVFMMCYFALIINKGTHTYKSLLYTTIILFTPIGEGGELTNLIIRGIYICYYLFQNRSKQITKYMKYMFICLISCSILVPLSLDMFSELFDANSLWRARYWLDELKTLSSTYFLGVGYGTTYATKSFVGYSTYIEYGPFAANSIYTTMEQMFVTGSHNSYITILYRLGPIGLYFLLNIIYRIVVNIQSCSYRDNIHCAYILFSAIFLIGVNVGLESPYYMFLFVFALGINNNYLCNMYLEKQNDQNFSSHSCL